MKQHKATVQLWGYVWDSNSHLLYSQVRNTFSDKVVRQVATRIKTGVWMVVSSQIKDIITVNATTRT